MYQRRKLFVKAPLLLLILSTFAYSLNSTSVLTITPVLYVNPDRYTANSLGETVSIQIKAYLIFNLTGYQFQLRFNTTLLQCLNASMGSLLPCPPNSSSTINIDNSQGVISIQATIKGNGTPASGWGPLLSLTFNATYATPYPQPKDTCTLEIANDTLYGIGNQTINRDVVNGVYKAPYAAPQLNLTLNTDRNNYHFEDRININGALTGNGYPIPDALIALEIQDPHGILVAARTFQTSSTQPSCPLQITDLTPCNLTGERQDSFAVGSLVCFDVAVKNIGSNSLNGLLVVNPYDSSNASLGVTYLTVPIPARSNTSMLLCLPLQYDTPLAVTPPTSGNATAYASIWTDLVENGGTPLSLESETTFTITGTAQHNLTSTSPPPQAKYQTSLSLHFKKGTYSLSQPPNYTVYVGATYMGIDAMQSKQIQITIAGDVSTDGRVSLSDLVLLANAYGSKPGDINWNPNADVNGDGRVNLPDVALLAQNYGKGTV